MGMLHAGEALVKALETVGEAFVVDAEAVEEGGIEVADVDGLVGDVVAKVVGFAVGGATFYTATGQPHAEAAAMVVAAIAEFALTVGSTAEFTSPDDESVFE